MRVFHALLIGGCVVGVGPVLAAQSNNQWSAQMALLNTPIGALGSLFTMGGVEAEHTPVGLAIRYGHYGYPVTSVNVDNVGLTALFKLSKRTHAELTGGFGSCSGCKAMMMGSAAFYADLARTDIGDQKDHDVLTVGIRPEIGAAHRSDTTPWYYSASLGFPVALSTQILGDVRVEPFIQPGAGYGMIRTESDHAGGVRPIAGGGVAFYVGSGVGIHLDAQRIIADNSTTQWGLGLSWR
jgi:hypothetical protein